MPGTHPGPLGFTLAVKPGRKRTGGARGRAWWEVETRAAVREQQVGRSFGYVQLDGAPGHSIGRRFENHLRETELLLEGTAVDAPMYHRQRDC